MRTTDNEKHPTFSCPNVLFILKNHLFIMIQQYTTVSIAQLLLLGNKKSGNTPNKKFYIQRAKQETFRTKTDTRKVTQNEAKIVTVIREVT